MTVYLVANTHKPEAIRLLQMAAQVLAQEGVTLLADGCDGQLAADAFPGRVLATEKAFEQADVVVSIGGDGTMLQAARHTMMHKKPLLGVNIGRLGFLTNIESDEVENLRRLARGDYWVEQRSVIRADIEYMDAAPALALNDLVLCKASAERAVVLDIFCDDIFVSHVRGDGVIIATPTGSTAYSMSAGGPIVDARLGGIVVTQICAHIVHTPPLVLSPERILRVVPQGTDDEKVALVCDGKQAVELQNGRPVLIRQSEWTVPLVQFNAAEQLESIDRKLKGR
ncbi:MAG: NAD(+)/NADH kinase [Oscillospiraceae bacterium]